MIAGDIAVDEAVRRVALSKHVGRILEKEDLERLSQFLADYPSCPMDDFPDELFDEILYGFTSREDTISFYIESDDEGNPTGAGPWPATVYGFAGVWLFQSPELDDAWYGDREGAVGHLWESAHEIVSVEKDYPIKPWQLAE